MVQLLLQERSAYKLDEVARSICSSNALLVEDPNQPAMVLDVCVCVRWDVSLFSVVVY
jgi:hypothetical protein